MIKNASEERDIRKLNYIKKKKYREIKLHK